ncbi:MAG: hypothetical protein QW046_04500 [Candidatus Micrarchaeaceae archaeon]
MYKTAKTTVALGGKLMGAGSSWFILFLFNLDQRNKVLSGMKEYRMEEFRIEPFSSKTVYLEDYLKKFNIYFRYNDL